MRLFVQRVGVALTGTLLLAIACGPSTPALVPQIRLLDQSHEAPEHRALVSGPWVAMDGVARQTMDASRQLAPNFVCRDVADDPDAFDCTARLPKGLRHLGWAILEVPNVEEPPVKGRRVRSSGEKTRVLLSRHEMRTRSRPIRLTRRERHYAQIRPLLPLGARATTTKELTISRHSRLRAGFGVEEAASIPGIAPVAFTVTVLRDGNDPPEEIFRQVLDPTEKTADRGWHALDLPLPVKGDTETMRLRLGTEVARPGDKRSSLPVWADPTIWAPAPKPATPRRVVLISLDTLRARSMSAYGHDEETTPGFQRLARQGVLFERAFTTYSNTFGSHMSMMSGLYPGTHLLFRAREGATLPRVLLAEALREAGYETAAFTEDGLLKAEFFRPGFSTYYENKTIRSYAGHAEDTFERALKWARENNDRPFFLFIHTYEVHFPYGAGYEGADPSGFVLPLEAYEREVVRLDGALSRLVAGLDALGEPEELLLIVTADHGEEFGEHGSFRHQQLFDEVMHIPLLLRWPGVLPEDRRVETPVSLVDIVPTVLDLIGRPEDSLDGTSLVSLIEGHPLTRSIVFGQSPHGRLGQHRRAVGRSQQAKCLVSDEDDSVACFDLAADPTEERPLAPDASPELGAVYREVLDYQARQRERLEGRTPELEITAESETDPARLEKLRALGYVD